MSTRNRTDRTRAGTPRRRAITSISALSAGALAVCAAAFGIAGSASAKSSWSTATSATAGGGMSALVKAAKAEKTLNVIALPSNWANYGAEISTLREAVRHQGRQRGPERLERPGDPGDQDLARPQFRARRRRRRRRVRQRRRQRGPVRALQGRDLGQHPRQPEVRQRRLLPGLRRIHLVRLQHEAARIHPVPDVVGGAEVSSQYKDDIALNGSPTLGQRGAVGRVGSGGQQRRLGQQHRAGRRLLQDAPESNGNFNAPTATRASVDLGLVPDHDQLGLPEHGRRLGPARQHPVEGRRSERHPVRRVLRPGRQQVRPAPGGSAPVGGVPVLDGRVRTSGSRAALARSSSRRWSRPAPRTRRRTTRSRRSRISPRRSFRRRRRHRREQRTSRRTGRPDRQHASSCSSSNRSRGASAPRDRSSYRCRSRRLGRDRAVRRRT